MSDRPGTDPSADKPDDDLAYLDAGLVDDAGEDAPSSATAPVGPPVDAVRESSPTEAVPVGPSPRATGTHTVVVPLVERDISWYWPLASLVGLLVVIGINLLANAWEFNGNTTGEVVNKDPVPFQPAGWVFSIWGLIYVLLLFFVVYGLFPAGRRNARLQRISPLFLVANIANVAWIFLWHWEQFLGSLVAILVLLAALVFIYLGLRVRNPIRRNERATRPRLLTRLVLWVPFSVYLAWVIVAALANLMVWLDREGWDGGPFSYNVWAVLFMIAATLVAALFTFAARDGLVPLVLAVAFVGIAQHTWGDSTFASIAAIVLAVVAVGLAGLAWVLAFERDSDRDVLGWRTRNEAPPPMTPID